MQRKWILTLLVAPVALFILANVAALLFADQVDGAVSNYGWMADWTIPQGGIIRPIIFVFLIVFRVRICAYVTKKANLDEFQVMALNKWYPYLMLMILVIEATRFIGR